jgi:hypothetical protein
MTTYTKLRDGNWGIRTTYTKLRDGNWGIRTTEQVAPVRALTSRSATDRENLRPWARCSGPERTAPASEFHCAASIPVAITTGAVTVMAAASAMETHTDPGRRRHTADAALIAALASAPKPGIRTTCVTRTSHDYHRCYVREWERFDRVGSL